jgi:hypothetical protein
MDIYVSGLTGTLTVSDDVFFFSCRRRFLFFLPKVGMSGSSTKAHVVGGRWRVYVAPFIKNNVYYCGAKVRAVLESSAYQTREVTRE